MKTIKYQYNQPFTKILQIGDCEEFLMESGPGANDQIDPTKSGNPAKEFAGDGEFESLNYQEYGSIWDDDEL